MAHYRIVPQRVTYAVEVTEPGRAPFIRHRCKTEKQAKAWIAEQKRMEAASDGFERKAATKGRDKR
jgi:hypothetical protein